MAYCTAWQAAEEARSVPRQAGLRRIVRRHAWTHLRREPGRPARMRAVRQPPANPL